MLTILGKLGGRKFLVAVFGALAIALHSWLNIDQQAVLALGGVLAAYVFGQGVADGFSGGATSTVGRLETPEAEE